MVKRVTVMTIVVSALALCVILLDLTESARYPAGGMIRQVIGIALFAAAFELADLFWRVFFGQL